MLVDVERVSTFFWTFVYFLIFLKCATRTVTTVQLVKTSEQHSPQFVDSDIFSILFRDGYYKFKFTHLCACGWEGFTPPKILYY